MTTYVFKKKNSDINVIKFTSDSKEKADDFIKKYYPMFEFVNEEQ